MQGQKSKYYTIMLVPSLEKVLKLTISKRAFIIILSVFAIALLSLVLLPFFIYKNVSLVKFNKHLRGEIVSQSEKIYEMSNTIKELEIKVSNVENFSRKIKFIALGGEEEDSSLLLGVGGVGIGSKNVKLDMVGRESALEYRMKGLEQSIERENNVLDSIFTLLQDKKSYLSSTPSIWPVRGWVTSEFGYRIDPFTGGKELHEGLDIATRLGTPVISPADGIVIYARYERSFGNTIIIEHGYGFTTLYGHLSEIYVEQGQRVNRGDVIGAVGNTGKSTGPHLHYEVRKNGVPVNPRDYILD